MRCDLRLRLPSLTLWICYSSLKVTASSAYESQSRFLFNDCNLIVSCPTSAMTALPSFQSQKNCHKYTKKIICATNILKYEDIPELLLAPDLPEGLLPWSFDLWCKPPENSKTLQQHKASGTNMAFISIPVMS